MADVKSNGDTMKVENGNSKKIDTGMSDLERKIIRQVEHYFGDYNMPRDKFLQEALKTDDGWVTMESMLKFKRLADLSMDPPAILAALSKSTTGLMETSGEGMEAKMRRLPSLPLPDNTDESKKDVESRTVYVKGFEKETTTLDELIEYFHGSFANVLNVNMRNWFDKRDKVRHFKGSVFVTFKDVASAQNLVEQQEVKYKDEDLVRKMQKKYFEDKGKEMDDKRKQRQNDKDKVQKAKGNVKEETKEEDFTLPKGATLKFTGLGGEVTREDIKETLHKEFNVNIEQDNGDIAFVTYNKGDEEAKIRFREENAAKPIAEKLVEKGKLTIGDREVTGSLLEGDEETQFLDDAVRDLKERRNRNRHGHKRRGGFQGGRGGKRGRR